MGGQGSGEDLFDIAAGGMVALAMGWGGFGGIVARWSPTT